MLSDVINEFHRRPDLFEGPLLDIIEKLASLQESF